ncbi:MAG: cupredoxin domain-containing protein [Gemmatimonadota bacterium]
MSWDVVVVDFAVASAIVWVVWFFWLSEKEAVRAAVAGGTQEVQIRVKGGYDPDVIIVESGRPVKLHFNRQETAACSEMVVFPDFGISRLLPAAEIVTLELTPESPGEYEFSCQMGMLRGKLVAR